MKKLEIEKTVGLVFSISNFFITKTPLANNWRRKKIPSCSYLALGSDKFQVNPNISEPILTYPYLVKPIQIYLNSSDPIGTYLNLFKAIQN